MGFGDNTRSKQDQTADNNQQDTIYFKLLGEQTIRILDRTEDVYSYWRYFMELPNVAGKPQKRSIVVRYGDTPIRNFMQSIGSEDKRFCKPSKRIISNILDRETGRVFILDYGPDLLNKLTPMHMRVRNYKTFEPMALWDFDLDIISTPGKEPKDVQRNVVAGVNQEPLDPELKALPIFDLTTIVRPMPNEMQTRLLAGEDLIDILKELNWPKPTPTARQ